MRFPILVILLKLLALALVLVFFLLPAFVSAEPSSVLDYDSAWRCEGETKFYWYCQGEDLRENPVKPPPEPQKTPQQQALEEVERIRKELESLRALAILNPTADNLKAYITAQEKTMDRASVFSDQWRRVIWQNPELNYELKRPRNNAATATYTDLRKTAEKKTIESIRDEWGIFFFFRSDCPYCHRMAPTLKFVAEQYGITVFPISVDGKGLPDYPNPRSDNGLVEKLNVKQVPMLVLGNVKDKRLVPLGSGLLAAQDIIERIYVLTSTKPGELY